MFDTVWPLVFGYQTMFDGVSVVAKHVPFAEGLGLQDPLGTTGGRGEDKLHYAVCCSAPCVVTGGSEKYLRDTDG